MTSAEYNIEGGAVLGSPYWNSIDPKLPEDQWWKEYRRRNAERSKLEDEIHSGKVRTKTDLTPESQAIWDKALNYKHPPEWDQTQGFDPDELIDAYHEHSARMYDQPFTVVTSRSNDDASDDTDDGE